MTMVPSPSTPLALDQLPGKSAEDSYVYVLRFSSGVIKVGMTRNPAQRLRQHSMAATQHGGEVSNHWLSRPHGAAQENERHLIAFCAERAPRMTANEKAGEYFSDLDFDAVVGYAETLSFVPAEPLKEPSEEQLQKLSESFQRAFGRRFALPPRPQVPTTWDGPLADATRDLLAESLDLRRETLDMFDAADRAAVDENLVDYFHAATEVAALKGFLADAELRVDTALFDARYEVRDALVAKYGITDLHTKKRTTASRMTEVRQQLQAESELPPFEALEVAMRRFTTSKVREFEGVHGLTWSSPDREFVLYRSGIRSDRTFSGRFRTMLAGSDGRYAARVDAVAEAMGMTEVAFLCEYAENEDDFPVLLAADQSRGIFEVELILSDAVIRIAQSAGFGVPLDVTDELDGGAR